LGGWRGFVAKCYFLLGAKGWLGYNITGETQHIIKYVGSGVSYRTYEKNKMNSEVSMF
jgi:hypothetical protein